MLPFASTVAASVESHIYGRSNSHTGHMCHFDESGHPRHKTRNMLRISSLRPGFSDKVRPQLCGLHNYCSVSFTRIWSYSITLLTTYCCHSYYGLLLIDVNNSFPTAHILGFLASLLPCIGTSLPYSQPPFRNLKWELLHNQLIRL